ncbi:MAG: Sensor protein TorS [Candidatus Accumulibacter phosphatis]|uniref:Sensor protein TorS n=2 Tax=Candidatus Accumulibacter TaxID=327159 RepID=A0A080M135_9PROT|nr:MAG: Sensor protein TorS [Candidatus Accumulibacter phosphatis]
MLKESFEQTIRQLCEDVLSEPTPEALPEKIIDHVQETFPVQWSTLWLTERKENGGGKQLRLAAAGGEAKKLLTAEDGKPAVYDFGEGLTGEIAELAQTCNITNYDEFEQHKHARKYDSVMYEQSRAEDECRCVLGVPLLLKSSDESNAKKPPRWRVIGVLKLENIMESADHPAAFFTPRDVEIVEAYAAVIAVALEKAQMRADSIRIGAGLLEVSTSLLANLGDEPNLDEIVEQTANVISAEACALWLRSGLQLRLKAAHGYQCSKADIPYYQLETTDDAIDHVIAGTPAEDSGEPPRYRNVGLTVYVALTAKSLNLTTADAVRNHFAWQGLHDGQMWDKSHGRFCYSLVAIPLIDRETQDVRGVFKIENKKPTLFQLQSFFTREDEQLLTILGNSISFSLVISDRIKRLHRLERLVGDVRILSDLDEALFFILTGLTHRDGLQYNRAMIYLVDEATPTDEAKLTNPTKPTDQAKPTRLICQFAIGQIASADWQEEVDRTLDDPPLELDQLMKDFRADKGKYLRNPMMTRWKGCEVDTEACRNVIAQHAALQPPRTLKYLSGQLPSADMLSEFARGDFVLIPITFEKTLKGIIYADNAFTGNRVNRFECSMLDLFAGMAGAIIQASGVPAKLQKERDGAWQAFSRPAAHRLGTEAGIIDDEATLYIKRELDGATPAPDGRVAVHGEVIRNSLKVIQQAVNRLRLAVKDYQRLAFMDEELVDFDLCVLVEKTIRNTASGLKGIKVSSHYLAQPLWIRAARGGIAYVFEELIINAWKETQSDDEPEAGEQKLEVHVLIELQREQDSAVCIVSDDGPGVPAALTTTIFLEPKPGRKGGTGLGLYISGQILKANRAEIELLSEGKPPGFAGACFKIILPLCASQDGAQSATGVRPTPSVLVVEDNPTRRRHLAKVLKEHGFTCELVPNENQAVNRLSATLRAIVADINLSEAGGDRTGGILLAEKLEQLHWKIPIILISADPWFYLPPIDSRKFSEMQDRLGIVSVLDRNSSTFYDELVTSLEKAMNV